MTPFVALFAVGLVGAVYALVRVPDQDRHLAYPRNPERWGGADGADSRHVGLLLSSFLFWSVCAAVCGLGGSILVAVGLHWIVALSMALLLGVIVSLRFGLSRLKHGPGMMFMLSRQRKDGDAAKPRVLFVCGSLNQTSQMHQISRHFDGIDPAFTPYASDHWLFVLGTKLGFQESTIAGYKRRRICLEYLNEHNLNVDLSAERFDYDMVVTCNDQFVPPFTHGRPLVLVQEGIQDPPNRRTWIWRHFRLFPRFMAGTSTFGLSAKFDLFCVASDGYKRHFASYGADPEKMVVTGIPNFDDCHQYYDNDFPHKDYVLACTSDARETLCESDRDGFLNQVRQVAAGRQVIVKLHPNENVQRATAEIKDKMPDAIVLTEGNAEQMVANCAVLFTEWSTLTFVGLALEKETYSNHDLDDLKQLVPIQNGGKSAKAIAEACRQQLVQWRPAISQARADHEGANENVSKTPI